MSSTACSFHETSNYYNPHKLRIRYFSSVKHGGAPELIPKNLRSKRKTGEGWRLPDVLGEAVLDEVLVLVLVEAHEDGVVAGLGPRLEVEHHPGHTRRPAGRPNGSRRGGSPPGSGRRNRADLGAEPGRRGGDCGEENRGIERILISGFVRVETKQSRRSDGGIFLILFKFISAFDFLRCPYTIHL